MKPRLIKPSPEEDAAIDKGIAHDPDAVESTLDEFKAMRPTSKAHPEVVAQYRRAQGERGPQKAPTKERITIRIDAEVLDFFKAGGSGWQTRLDQVLKEYVQEHRR